MVEDEVILNCFGNQQGGKEGGSSRLKGERIKGTLVLYWG